MMICCPDCETGYQIRPDALGANGRSVRCNRCRRVWFATPEAEPVAAEAVEAEFTPPRRADGRPADPLYDPLVEFIPAQDPVLGPRAEPIEVDGPALAPAIDHPPTPSVHLGEAPLILDAKGEIKTAAKPKPKRVRKPWRWPRPGLRAAAIVFIGLVGGLTLMRTDIVRIAPQTATLYSAIGLPVNLRGLAFENVTSVKEQRDGVTVLVVEGTIVSASPNAVEVPRLRIALRGDAGNEVYVWTAAPNRSILAPGETLPFKTRLASPPPEGRDVLVRFAQRREGDAGGR
jgi:predicted Zn finger-like uncharacterized protein